MKSSAVLAALTGLFAIAHGTPVAPAHPLPLHRADNLLNARQNDPTNSSAPCARVSQAVYGSNSGPIATQVPAGLAYECITSVPFNKTSAHKLLKALPAYLNWQSTLTVLKNPPAEYAEKVQPPIDILGGLDKIAADIDADRFTSEYDFGWTLYTLIQSAHDGHFAYIPDSVGGIFNFGRKVPLVSVSVDGKQLPSIFTFEDVLGLQFKNVSYTPSPIVEIDGVPAEEFLENLSQYGSLQDRDALYNNVFYELAQISLGTQGGGTGMFTGGGRGRWVYPGANTKFKFSNGTEATIENYARVLQSFRGIETGEDLAKQWFWYGSGSQAQAMIKEEERVQNLAKIQDDGSNGVVPGYPEPIVPGPASLINGFYVDVPGYEDVAVLQVPNFVGIETAEIGFQKVTRDFIPKALADGKTKLIIDLQANGGGTILQGYDMFKQLFPDIDPYGANRFRAIEAVDLIGQSFSAFGSQFPRVFTRNTTITRTQGSYFDYHMDMTVEGKPFSSWKEKFGPQEVNGDFYTTLNRWNLSDVYIPYNSGGINVTGYGPLANETGPAKFKPENIVLLTDGYCASTCTIFSEFMTKQAGVTTIALGGRSNRNPIQAIGGVKGTNNFQWGFIQSLAANAINVATGELKTYLNTTLRAAYYNDIVFNRASASPGVNVRDGLLYNDTSGVALQFIYEEADCRLYYTPEMTVSATAMWTAAADAKWGNKGNCVGGEATYGKKREEHEVTTQLRPRRVQMSKAVAMRQLQAFEDSFSLETLSNMKGDGFMHP